MAVSSAVAGCGGRSVNGACAPSTTMSTSEMWMTSSNPPRRRGRCSLTSRMTMSARSRMARDTPVAAERLKYPWRSIGATDAMATLTVRNSR